MRENTRKQVGSPSRDAFKRAHKDLDSSFYACDLDFVLVEKAPVPGVVAVLDYKTNGDTVSFSEVITYNALIQRGIPVFIVKGDVQTGKFEIHEFKGGHHKAPDYDLSLVTRTYNWAGFQAWEWGLREAFRRKYGPR